MKIFNRVSYNHTFFLSICFLSPVGRGEEPRFVSTGGRLRKVADSWMLLPLRGGPVSSPVKSGWSWLLLRLKEHGGTGFVSFQEQA